MKARFGEYTLDSSARLLKRGEEAVHLSRKAFDALCVLLDRRPAAVPKEELHARLWPGTFVSDANLSVVIAELRRALGDEPQTPRYIRTVHRVGYAFCADADETALPLPADDRPRAWLVWEDRTLPLAAGASVIGRDPGCAVWLDVPGVSRRHAQIVVDDASATIEDLSSKNGTFVGHDPVAAARTLVDGDRVRVGPTEMVFRMSHGARTTETVRIRRR
jgi:DNA-binding winged helix-turn-helix (wHTH) protein